MSVTDQAGDTTRPTPSAPSPATWRRKHSKLHREDGITVEIRPLDPDLTIIAGNRPVAAERHRWLAQGVRRCLGTLMPYADVTVLMASDTHTYNEIARAIWWCDCYMLGGDIPRGTPQGTKLLEMPWTEVCMHLGVAGRLMWAAPVDDDMAQLYDPDGAIFSTPILRAEAGLLLAAGLPAQPSDAIASARSRRRECGS